MLRWLPAPLKVVFVALALCVNTLLAFIAFIPFALLKLLLPVPALRKLTDRCLIGIAFTWVRCNGLWMRAIERANWQISTPAGLNPQGWYLVSANHQSWADILVLQSVFAGRIPFLKFFLKRELIFVPIIGLAWWALDFPFMRRGKGGRASAAADLQSARRACEKFRNIPTSVINFLEGTRASPAKIAQQHSPYRHLLKPKSGGASIALATMGELFESMLDVTIVYPDGVPNFLDVMCGRMGRVCVEIRRHEIPAALAGAAGAADPHHRAHVQEWLNGIWQEKDARITALQDQCTGQLASS